MEGSEITESAKAVQETAKAVNTGFQATQQLGGFLARITQEPLGEAIGIITDRLRFFRWERQLRLEERANEIIKERNIDPLRIVAPKIAIPIFENASLEENDELQDLWAFLLASAVDPKFSGEIRSGYIEIIKQLEIVDVHILNFAYQTLREAVKRNNDDVTYLKENPSFYPQYAAAEYRTALTIRPETVPIHLPKILAALNIELEIYKAAIDNLIRMGCLAPHTIKQAIKVPAQKQRFRNITLNNDSLQGKLDMENVRITQSDVYERVCLTTLGVGFVLACLPQPMIQAEN
jgi:hypothetical protein